MALGPRSLVALSLLLLPAAASAAEYSAKLEVQLEKDGVYTVATAEDRKRFFNSASCLCNAPFAIRVDLTNAQALDSDRLEVWTGVDCKRFGQEREEDCDRIRDFEEANFRSPPVRVEIGTQQLFAEIDLAARRAECARAPTTRKVSFLIDDGRDQDYDHEFIQEVALDTEAPPLPANLRLTGAESGVEVTWDLPSDITDIRGFQVLCRSTTRAEPLFATPRSQPEYRREVDVCPAGPLPNPSPTSAGAPSAPSYDGASWHPDAADVHADAELAGDPLADDGLVVLGHDGGHDDAAPPDASPVDAAGSPDAAPDGGVSGTDPLAIADPRYLCTAFVGNGQRSAFIDFTGVQLAEGEEIVATVVTVDPAGNFSVVTAPGSARPQPARDGWEHYRGAGGQADGGFCFVATAAYGDYDHPYVRVLRRLRDQELARTTAGRAFIGWYYESSPPLADFLRHHPVARAAAWIALLPVVGLAAAWLALGPLGLAAGAAGLLGLVLLRRARRRRAAAAGRAPGAPGPRSHRAARALVAGGVALALLAGARAASAQVVLEERDLDEELEPPRSRWLLDLKGGPYYPGIDREPGLTGRPYEEMYGADASFMPRFGLTYVLLYPLGQLGVTGELGYTSESAKAFVDEPGEPRRSGDTTTFHLLPVSVSATYRFTELADRTVVPLVPYARAGLAYGVWWFTKRGGLSDTPDGGEALGGTLGWEASLGLALRADALDPEAARNLQGELGIEHAGFFAEVVHADLSGLGRARSLHVGDTTWFAGATFEF